MLPAAGSLGEIDQVTPVFVVPCTTALNCAEPPTGTGTDDGWTATVIGTSVAVAVPHFWGFSVLQARIGTCVCTVTGQGAV
jgi:hypothetical protein